MYLLASAALHVLVFALLLEMPAQANGTRACPKDHRDRDQDGTSPSDCSFEPAATDRFPGGAGDSTAAGEGGREETAAGSDSSASRAEPRKSSPPLRPESSRPKKSSRPFRLCLMPARKPRKGRRKEARRKARGTEEQREGVPEVHWPA